MGLSKNPNFSVTGATFTSDGIEIKTKSVPNCSSQVEQFDFYYPSESPQIYDPATSISLLTDWKTSSGMYHYQQPANANKNGDYLSSNYQLAIKLIADFIVVCVIVETKKRTHIENEMVPSRLYLVRGTDYDHIDRLYPLCNDKLNAASDDPFYLPSKGTTFTTEQHFILLHPLEFNKALLILNASVSDFLEMHPDCIVPSDDEERARFILPAGFELCYLVSGRYETFEYTIDKKTIEARIGRYIFQVEDDLAYKAGTYNWWIANISMGWSWPRSILSYQGTHVRSFINYWSNLHRGSESDRLEYSQFSLDSTINNRLYINSKYDNIVDTLFEIYLQENYNHLTLFELCALNGDGSGSIFTIDDHYYPLKNDVTVYECINRLFSGDIDSLYSYNKSIITRTGTMGSYEYYYNGASITTESELKNITFTIGQEITLPSGRNWLDSGYYKLPLPDEYYKLALIEFNLTCWNPGSYSTTGLELYIPGTAYNSLFDILPTNSYAHNYIRVIKNLTEFLYDRDFWPSYKPLNSYAETTRDKGIFGWVLTNKQPAPATVLISLEETAPAILTPDLFVTSDSLHSLDIQMNSSSEAKLYVEGFGFEINPVEYAEVGYKLSSESSITILNRHNFSTAPTSDFSYTYDINWTTVSSLFRNLLVLFYANLKGLKNSNATPWTNETNTIYFSDPLSITSPSFTYYLYVKAGENVSITFNSNAMTNPSGSHSGNLVVILSNNSEITSTSGTLDLLKANPTFLITASSIIGASTNYTFKLKDYYNTEYNLGTIKIASTGLQAPGDYNINLYTEPSSNVITTMYADEITVRFTEPLKLPNDLSSEDCYMRYTVYLLLDGYNTWYPITVVSSTTYSGKRLLFCMVPSTVNIDYGTYGNLKVEMLLFAHQESELLQERALSEILTANLTLLYRGAKPNILNNKIKIDVSSNITPIYTDLTLPSYAIYNHTNPSTWAFDTGDSNIKLSYNFRLGYCTSTLPLGSEGQKIKINILGIPSGTLSYYTLGSAEITSSSNSTWSYTDITLSSPAIKIYSLDDFSGNSIRIVGKTYNLMDVNGTILEVQYGAENDIDFSLLYMSELFKPTKDGGGTTSWNYDFNKDGIILNSNKTRRIMPTTTSVSPKTIGDYVFSKGNGAIDTNADSFKNNGIQIRATYTFNSEVYDIPIPYTSGSYWNYKWLVDDNGTYREALFTTNSNNTIIYPCFGTRDTSIPSTDYYGEVCPSNTMRLLLNSESPYIYPFSAEDIEKLYTQEEIQYKIVTFNKVKNQGILLTTTCSINFGGEVVNAQGTLHINSNPYSPPMIKHDIPPYTSSSIDFIYFKDLSTTPSNRSKLIFSFPAWYDPNNIITSPTASASDYYRYNGKKLREGMTDPLTYKINRYTYDNSHFTLASSIILDGSASLTSSYISDNLYYTASIPVYTNNGEDLLSCYLLTAFDASTHIGVEASDSVAVDDSNLLKYTKDGNTSTLCYVGRIGVPDIRMVDIARTSISYTADNITLVINRADYQLVAADNGYGLTFLGSTMTSDQFYCSDSDDLDIYITERDIEATGAQPSLVVDFVGTSTSKISIKNSLIFGLGKIPVSSTNRIPENMITTDKSDLVAVLVRDDRDYDFNIHIDLSYYQYTGTTEYTSPNLYTISTNYLTYLPINFPTVSIRKNKIGINQLDLSRFNEELLVYPKHRVDHPTWHTDWDTVNTSSVAQVEYYPNVLSIGGDAKTAMPDYAGVPYTYPTNLSKTGAYIGFYANTDTSDPLWIGSIGFDEDFSFHYIRGGKGLKVKTTIPGDVHTAVSEGILTIYNDKLN